MVADASTVLFAPNPRPLPCPLLHATIILPPTTTNRLLPRCRATWRRPNNYRTFLSWLHFAVVLGGLAVGLLNFGDKVGKISAAMYTVIGQSSPQTLCPDARLISKCIVGLGGTAMGVMIYALVIYQSRARAIRQRTGAPYDDRLGPVSVAAGMTCALEDSC